MSFAGQLMASALGACFLGSVSAAFPRLARRKESNLSGAKIRQAASGVGRIFATLLGAGAALPALWLFGLQESFLFVPACSTLLVYLFPFCL